ncbi:inorganic pyrophosphatase [Hymenobacter daecheongensis DSM 21074]|uniref:inorganic diphosphatase n=1 Tax=Hymenobacter daecheongensis DSM 21074 TaxID=1121955 RepID=A0A1M6CJT4_9BACT|nr:inorganic diphosphatase [Hymenobacter daecheongensis]SHI61282.1 inorganic pyrophosphatase [Hymenobacter daecheongensis DSM 21074]
MRFARVAFLLWTGSLGVVGCQTDYAQLPTFSRERKLLQAVVEIPAGTNHEQVYDPETKDFRRIQRAGQDRQVEFLPYPGNFGFVPGTRTSAAPGFPQGRPLGVLILSESQPAGTVVEVLPVGLLLLDAAGLLEQVVLAIPARPSQQILPETATWAEFTQRYPAAKEILRLWFQHRGGPGEVRIVGWKDERFAQQQVRAAMR